MRALVTWTVRAVFAVAATCAAVTMVSFTQHSAEAAKDTEPFAVSPRKPPLDAGLDGPVPLPPIPDAKFPLGDAAVTPMIAN